MVLKVVCVEKEARAAREVTVLLAVSVLGSAVPLVSQP